MKRLLMICLLIHVSAAYAQLTQLDKLKGTWLITYADTAKNGAIHQDSILTKLGWSADGQSLEGDQRVKTAQGITHNTLRYFYNDKTRICLCRKWG